VAVVRSALAFALTSALVLPRWAVAVPLTSAPLVPLVKVGLRLPFTSTVVLGLGAAVWAWAWAGGFSTPLFAGLAASRSARVVRNLARSSYACRASGCERSRR